MHLIPGQLITSTNTPGGGAALNVWDAATLEARATASVPGGLAPDCITASPDGRTLLTADRSGPTSGSGSGA
jgi:hypothetical protein